METVAQIKRQEAELDVAELEMLGVSLGVTKVDKIRNQYITAQVEQFGDNVREERLTSVDM